MFECKICRVEKHITEFHKHIRKLNGIHPWCKSCRFERDRLNKTNSYFTYTYSRKKSECKMKGISFDLTPEYLESLWTGKCSIFNSEIKFYFDEKVSMYHPERANLDRIIPDKGYVQGNVQWTCGRANRLKADGTIEELELILKYMKDKKV